MDIYSKQLVAEGVLTEDEVKRVETDYLHECSEALTASKDYELKDVHWLESVWAGFKSPVQVRQDDEY